VWKIATYEAEEDMAETGVAPTKAKTETPLMGPAQQFVDKVRALFADGFEEAVLWDQIGEELRILLATPELQAHTGT